MRSIVRTLLMLPWLSIGLGGLLLFSTLLLPFKEINTLRDGPWSLRLTDRHGRLLQILPVNNEGLRREFIALESVPPRLVLTMIESEDRRFRLHPGVDPVAILRALRDNLRAGRVVSGASTVTMQLAGRLHPAGDGIGSKFREAWDALRLELRLSKNEILELWLNTLPFGSNVEGILSGSRRYFGNSLLLLTSEEAVALSRIPRSPARYAGEPVSDWPFNAPHFSALIAGRYQGSRREPVATTLDMELQAALEGIIASRVSAAAEYRISTGAGLVLDSKTGEVLAYVGSADFYDSDASGQIDGVQILRQPGSTLKPFLYAQALEAGMTPSTLLPDVPLEFGAGEVYTPENFSNTYRGPVRLRVALASSLNIPAVHTVVQVGVASFVDRLIALGFSSLIGSREELGSGIALGNAEVSLFELATAFSVFPRKGVYLPARIVLYEELDRELDRGLDGTAPVARQVIDSRAAFLIRDILASPTGRIPGFGTETILNTPFEAIFKTGTSDQFTNIWALGATEKLTVGIWMGNFGGATVIGRPGSSLPAAAAVEFLTQAQEISRYRSEAAGPGQLPAGIVEREICSFSGQTAGPECPGRLREYFIMGTEPKPCQIHRGGRTVLPAEYRQWAGMKGINADYEGAGELTIHSPVPGAVYYLDPGLPAESQSLRVELDGGGALELLVDGIPVVRGESPLIYHLPLRRGEHLLEARAEDARRQITFFVR